MTDESSAIMISRAKRSIQIGHMAEKGHFVSVVSVPSVDERFSGRLVCGCGGCLHQLFKLGPLSVKRSCSGRRSARRLVDQRQNKGDVCCEPEGRVIY